MKNLPVVFVEACCLAFFLSACHERGCTNRDAINYNNTADQDDGSCIVCKTTSTFIDSTSMTARNPTYGTPYYQQMVVRFILTQYCLTQSDKECGSTSNSVHLQIQNLKPMDMYIGSFNLDVYSGPITFDIYEPSSQTYVPAMATVDKGMYANAIRHNPNCSPITLDSLYVSGFSLSFH